MELEQKKEHLLAFAKRMTEGIEYIKNKDDHKGLEMLQPFIDLMNHKWMLYILMMLLMHSC